MRERLAAAISKIQDYQDVRPDELEWEFLGGMTNVSYLATYRDVELVVRFPGDGTEAFIDRHAEVANAEAACLAGLTNTILYFDPSDSVMITAMMRAARPHEKADHGNPGVLERVVAILKRVHEELAFGNSFNPFELLGVFNSMAASLGARRTADLESASRSVDRLRPILESAAPAAVACHNDPVPGNFLHTDNRLLLIDWEYSGRNDPAWDLASLILEWDLGPEQTRRVLAAYASDDPTLPLRVAAYRPVADLVWSVWAIVQTGRGRDDFVSYGEDRLDRCLQAIAAPAFAADLEELRDIPRT